MSPKPNRRQFLRGATTAGLSLVSQTGTGRQPPFRFRYVLSSCLYGMTGLDEILPEVRKVGAEHIDIWPKVHGNQREQIEAMGHERFLALLGEHRVKLAVLTHYDLGPFALQDEMRVAQKLGGSMVICGGSGPKGLTGRVLRSAVENFAETMKPHIAIAEETGVTIGIENHGNNLIESPDSLKWLVEFAPSKHIGIALAPYHLEQDPRLIGRLIGDLGERIVMFYAWQHGRGAAKKLPKDQELEQLPGRGPLDFGPVVRALAKIRYSGWVSIFMHPVPRGIAILETTTEVTAEVNRARRHLESFLPSDVV